MEQVGSRRWTAEASFACDGTKITIRTNRAAALKTILALLPPGSEPLHSNSGDQQFSLWVAPRRPRGRIRDAHIVYAGASIIAVTRRLDHALDRLLSALHFSVATFAERLFIHAGVVGWNGRAIVIPGRSFSGKTTLVEALVRNGATYFSDEYASFDRAGRVLPYAKPLSIRGSDQTRRHVRGEELGAVGTHSLSVGWIVDTQYHSGAPWNPRSLSRADCMMALLSNTVMARQRPQLTMTTLRRVVAVAAGLTGKRGSAAETAKWLLAATPWTSRETFPA